MYICIYREIYIERERERERYAGGIENDLDTPRSLLP